MQALNLTKVAESDSYARFGDSFYGNSSSLNGTRFGPRWKLNNIVHTHLLECHLTTRTQVEWEMASKYLILD
jgi:hypothetical protein